MRWSTRLSGYNIPIVSTAAIQSNWIANPRMDLGFIIGGVGFSLGFLALHTGAGIDAAILWWIWIVGLDGPHIFATLSRTYLDTEERRQRRLLLLGSLAWFGVGPACVAVSIGLGHRAPFDIFLVFASLWAYWHVVRQHYGIMVLYKKKNDDMARADNFVDSITVYVGQIAPLVAFAFSHPQARRMLGLPKTIGSEAVVVTIAWAVFAAAVAGFAARQIQRYQQNLPINGPKILLLTAVVGLAALLFSPYVIARSQFTAVFIVVTAFHNVQYHAVVWMYHRRRYHGSETDSTPFGWAPKVSGRFLVYAFCGVAFTLGYRMFACSLGSGPFCSGNALSIEWPAGLAPRDLVIGFIWGFALHHYYLDQKIWRVKKDERLQRDLNLQT